MPPLPELLEGAVRCYDCEEPPAQRLATLEGCVRHYELPLTEVVPLLAALLSLPLVRSPRACPCPFSSCSSLSGLSVEACVSRLKRYHYAFRRLHQIFTARITAEPVYELKTGFAHHAYLCAEHVEAVRARVGEMREPPLGLEAIPHAALELFFDEILAAPTTEALLVGLYAVALPALDAALARHIADTNPLADAPSVRILRFARLELADRRRAYVSHDR